MSMKVVSGGVTASAGFSAASCAAGIKYQGRTDMAMIYSTVPCAAAGTFTTNKVKAAPVLWDMEVVRAGCPVQAVVVNAGIANAATGKTGLDLCRATAEYTGKSLGIPASSVLLGSTGVIGPNIPLDKITDGVSRKKETLSNTQEAGTEASRAIMTTDTVNKEFAVSFDLPASDGNGTVTVHLGGMSKGSGMIHPNMCTMLGYITTDCAVSEPLLKKALRSVVPDTFNMITVDGDTSTNDTLLFLANGLAGNKPIESEDESYALLCEALYSVCRDLAVLMASDGEGATHLVEMRVYHADTKENARTLARSVVGSSLVKAMIFGRDANSGRIMCAMGYSGVNFDPERVDIYFESSAGRVQVIKDGMYAVYSEEEATKILSQEYVTAVCDMKNGSETATAWGCDLTYDYVKINGDYRS